MWRACQTPRRLDGAWRSRGSSTCWRCDCLVGALLRPERSQLLVQYVLYAAILAAMVVTPFTGPRFLIIVTVLLLVPLTYPYPGELFSLRSQNGPSLVLLAVAVIAAAVLVALAVHAIRI